MNTTLFEGIVIREFLPTDIPAAVELWKQTPGVGAARFWPRHAVERNEIGLF